jgi:uncharacterized protein with PIN domain
MVPSETELKARLMAKAEAAIDSVLATRPAPAEASLADIEQVALAASQRVAQAVTEALVGESQAELPPWPTCPACGGKMKNKGKRRRRVVTESGVVEVERAYYHCAPCGRGLFPPG